MTKYELITTDDTPPGMFRVKALKDFGNIKAGTVGGIVAGEHNLSQDGLCWLDYASKAKDLSRIRHNAQVTNSVLLHNAVAKNNTQIQNSTLLDQCKVTDAAFLKHCTVQDQAVIRDNVLIENCIVADQSVVRGYISLSADIKIQGTSQLRNRHDIVWFSNVGTECDTLVATRDKRLGVRFSRGCFSGSAEQFITQSMIKHTLHTHQEYTLLLKMAYLRILDKKLDVKKIRRRLIKSGCVPADWCD